MTAPRISEIMTSVKNVVLRRNDVPDRMEMATETIETVVSDTTPLLASSVTRDQIFSIPIVTDEAIPRGVIRMTINGEVVAEVGRFNPDR